MRVGLSQLFDSAYDRTRDSALTELETSFTRAAYMVNHNVCWRLTDLVQTFTETTEDGRDASGVHVWCTVLVFWGKPMG